LKCEQLIEILELVGPANGGSSLLGSALNPGGGGASPLPQPVRSTTANRAMASSAHTAQHAVGSTASAIITIESLRVEVVTLFWARTVDRANQGGRGLGWTDVVRKLDMEGQV
jgi:hypothetical protein